MTYSGTNVWAISLGNLETQSKIDSFRKLPPGWHYGRGGPISDVVIAKAKEILCLLVQKGLTSNDAFPGADGEIQLTAYHADHYISVIIEPDLSASFIHEKLNIDVIVPIEAVDLDRIKAEIARAAVEIWNLSDMYTRSIMIKNVNASPSWDLKSHQKTAQRQLLATSA